MLSSFHPCLAMPDLSALNLCLAQLAGTGATIPTDGVAGGPIASSGSGVTSSQRSHISSKASLEWPPSSSFPRQSGLLSSRIHSRLPSTHPLEDDDAPLSSHRQPVSPLLSFRKAGEEEEHKDSAAVDLIRHPLPSLTRPLSSSQSSRGFASARPSSRPLPRSSASSPIPRRSADSVSSRHNPHSSQSLQSSSAVVSSSTGRPQLLTVLLASRDLRAAFLVTQRWRRSQRTGKDQTKVFHLPSHSRLHVFRSLINRSAQPLSAEQRLQQRHITRARYVRLLDAPIGQAVLSPSRRSWESLHEVRRDSLLPTFITAVEEEETRLQEVRLKEEAEERRIQQKTDAAFAEAERATAESGG